MNDPQDEASEARRREQLLAVLSGAPANPGMPGWLKLVLILVIGIPLGLIALAGLVLGACLLGAR